MTFLLASLETLEDWITILALVWCSTAIGAQDLDKFAPISVLNIHQDIAQPHFAHGPVSRHRCYYTIPERRFIGATRRLSLCKHR